MATIDVLQKELRETNNKGVIGPNVISVLNSYGDKILKDIIKRSAKDSGTYRGNWRFEKAKQSKYPRLRFTNDTPYADVLIEGAPVGGEPWFFPRGKLGKSSKFVSSRSGKLKVGRAQGAFGWFLKGAQTRVWAGGKDPGDPYFVGGVTAGLLSDSTFQKEFRSAIVTAVIKDLL